ncbi:MAG: alpha/beta hydrolase [Nocardioides sp.]|nr:alpha/beta hydrolase [Nocardioides sp.]
MPTPSVRAGSGEPLLLLHPFMTSHDVWADVVPRLARGFDVLAPTLPGHWGGPHLPRRQVSIEAFADGVEALLDREGWDTCHVAGNSIGGWLALEMARRGRARSVTAIAPAGGWDRFSPAQMRVGAAFLSLAPLAMAGRVTGDVGSRLAAARRVALGVVSGDVAAVPRVRADALVRAATRCSAFLPYVWSDLRVGGVRDLAAVHRSGVPVRLVLCERDRLLPPRLYGGRFLEALPDAEVVRLDEVGHVPMLEAPGLVADLVGEHAAAHRTGPVLRVLDGLGGTA